MGGLSAGRQRRFEELLAQARSGSRDAYQALVDPFERVLRHRSRRGMERQLRGKISDSDLRQITYLQSFENLSEFQGNTFEEFGCWLLGILDHVRQMEHRAYHRQARDVSREVPLEEIGDRLATGSERAGEDEKTRRIEGALQMLPHAYRQVICWHYYERCHHEEIGRRLGISADAARHLFHRAMKKLADGAHKQEGE